MMTLHAVFASHTIILTRIDCAHRSRATIDVIRDRIVTEWFFPSRSWRKAKHLNSNVDIQLIRDILRKRELIVVDCEY